jgi:hypothetical protein
MKEAKQSAKAPEIEPTIKEVVYITGANSSYGVCVIQVFCPPCLTKEDLHEANLKVGALAHVLAKAITAKISPDMA